MNLPSDSSAKKQSASIRFVRLLYSLGTIVFIAVTSSVALADDTITNIMSPVVSYQYYDTLTETNSTIVSLPVSYQFYDSLTDDNNSPVISPVVSYQFYDSLTDMGTNSVIVSPMASYQYFDWPGNSVLNLLSSPVASYYYNTGGPGSNIAIFGQVLDSSGAPLAGVTVTASIYNVSQAIAKSASDGSYVLPLLPPGIYMLNASLALYASSVRAFSLTAATAQQNFQLAVLPAPPATVQTSLQPPASFTQPPTGPMGSTLKIFNGTTFVAIDANNKPNPNVMTVVMTHGWTDPLCDVNTGICGWPTTMAAELQANGVTPKVANIVGWDWFQGAFGCPFPPEENTPGQGAALGSALQCALGVAYSQPLHFIGHSLGTMVNAAAVDYVHGEANASSQPVSSTPWSGPMQMTLFDNAELTTELSGNVQVYFDGTTVNQAATGILLPPNALQGWASVMPLHCTWADNYVSLIGVYEPSAVNVLLQRGIAAAGAADPLNAHGYPMTWYDMSISDTMDVSNPLGFQQSYEYAIINGNDSLDALPPSENGLQAGAAYYQSSESDQLSLAPLPGGSFLTSLYGDASGVLLQNVNAAAEGYVSSVQVAGDVEVGVEDVAQQAEQVVLNGVNFVQNASEAGGQAVVNLYDSAILDLTLQTGPPSQDPQPEGLQIHPNIQQTTSDGTNTPAMAWVPVQIPTTALAMAFDFTISGNPEQDSLVCGIGESNLFSLQAQYIPTNTVSASRLIDVSGWSGQQVDLFFGVMGGTSTNASLEIDNIRFYSLQPPSLTIGETNGVVSLSWPNAANSYILEFTTNLSTLNWIQCTNPPSLMGGSFVVTNSWPDQECFFRLLSE